jgi:transposase InsO family protein
MLKPKLPERDEPAASKPASKQRIVTAKRPNHVWHVDLTIVPIASGFWVPWLPSTLPQCWPFCWWVAIVVDHFSRRVMGTASFRKQPTSEDVRAFLGRTMAASKAKPKYLICDRGGQFDCDGFCKWCKRHGVKPRYGKVGKHGSIAVVERLIRTFKELLRQLPLVPMRQKEFREELSLLTDWYNEHRPHMILAGRTPDEVYHNRFPANRKPRYEPRSRWPRGSPCAKPWALTRGRPGARLELDLTFLEGRKHLPIVALKRAA